MMNLFNNKHRAGFTLIELLVVVSIIGLLASIVVVSLGGSRVQSRDTKRVADLRQMQQAYELCYNDLACATANANDYPVVADGKCVGVPGYMAESPVDPLAAGENVYKCYSTAQRYCMSAKMEGSTDPAKAWVWVTPQGTETAKTSAVSAADADCKA